MWSACSDVRCNNKRYSSCKLYEQPKASEASTFGKRKIGPPRQLLWTVRTVSVDSAHSYCGACAQLLWTVQLLRTVRIVNADSAHSYCGQCAQLLRNSAQVTAGSAHSHCGQI